MHKQLRRVRMYRQVMVRVRRGLRKVDHDAGVNGDGAALVDNQRIDVHLLDPGQFTRNTGDTEQHIDKLVQNDSGYVVEVANQSASGRIVSALEGGYELKSLARCVETHIRVLMSLQ